MIESTIQSNLHAHSMWRDLPSISVVIALASAFVLIVCIHVGLTLFPAWKWIGHSVVILFERVHREKLTTNKF